MPAYQIQVRGELDGSTLFVPPTPLPAPADGGVIKIDAGVGVDVGRFDLAELAGAEGVPIWLRVYQVEPAQPATRGLRTLVVTDGALVEEWVTPDIAPSRPEILMRPFILATNIIQPVGGFLQILTDDTSDAFTGDPTTGPHFIYMDLVPIVNDEILQMAQDLAAFADMDSRANGEIFTSVQPVATTSSDILGNVSTPQGANMVGSTAASAQIARIQVSVGDAPAGPEQMEIFIRTRFAGVTRTLATVTLDDMTPADSVLDVGIDNRFNFLEQGATILVDRTYNAGMAPEPMTNTIVRIQVVPQQLEQVVSATGGPIE